MELVSGPDVGGGFLFQLTRERTDPLAVFTVHAQEGGLDGGAGRPGNPDRIGFSVFPGMCPIGGRHCYHRDFEIAIARTAQVRFAYNRMRFVIGPMLEQLAGERAIPFANGMEETLSRVSSRLAKDGVPWMVGGSASAALQGVDLAPRDVDLLTTEAGVAAIGEALEEYLIEAPARTQWGSGPARMAGRAFVGTLTDGLRVEWAAALADPVAQRGPSLEWGERALSRPRHAPRAGALIPVAPLEFALASAARRGDNPRIEALLSVLLRIGVDRDLWRRLFDPGETVGSALASRLAPAPENPT